jgi:sigma-B regulation protein RsbU (phosphoserine phosphatase)
LTVHARYIPYAELAGDFYDYAFKSDAATLLVADVSGHGASAAMLTGVVKSAFHAASGEDYEPAAVVTRVSNGIRAFSHHHFVTMICIRVRRGMLDFVNAGHPSGIVWGRDTPTMSGANASPTGRSHQVRLLESTGALISPAFELGWEQYSIPVQAGDRILLFSDGITDAEGEAGSYGFDRIVADAVYSRDKGNVLLDRIVYNVREFAAGRPFHDDLTVVLAEL